MNLPAVGAGSADLARLLLVSFANVYGNDWWLIPADLEIGSVHRIKSLTVTDTFGGDPTTVLPTDLVHKDGWCAVRLTDAATGRPGPPWLPLLPTAGHLLEGDPVERRPVRPRRDGGPRVGNRAGRAEFHRRPAAARRRAPRSGCHGAERSAHVPADGAGTRALDPARTGTPHGGLHGSAQFRRGRISGSAAPAAGQVLEPEHGRVTFRDEEITRAGVRVSRVPVLARWLGGTTSSWTSRRTRAGQGEASSRLRFDEAVQALRGRLDGDEPQEPVQAGTIEISSRSWFEQPGPDVTASGLKHTMNRSSADLGSSRLPIDYRPPYARQLHGPVFRNWSDRSRRYRRCCRRQFRGRRHRMNVSISWI